MDESTFKRTFGDFDNIKKQGELKIGDVLKIPAGTRVTIAVYGGDTTYILQRDCEIYVHSADYHRWMVYPVEGKQDAVWFDIESNSVSHDLYKFDDTYKPCVILPDGTQVDSWTHFLVQD